MFKKLSMYDASFMDIHLLMYYHLLCHVGGHLLYCQVAGVHGIMVQGNDYDHVTSLGSHLNSTFPQSNLEVYTSPSVYDTHSITLDSIIFI